MRRGIIIACLLLAGACGREGATVPPDGATPPSPTWDEWTGEGDTGSE